MNQQTKSFDGKKDLSVGLMVSWVAQVLQIASGFVVPRMIDSGMGSATLGIWDFGWSLVSYFSLIEGGIGSSVNRYVALEQGKGDMEGVNRIVSSAACLQGFVGTGILLLACLSAWGIPIHLQGVGPDLEQDARWLIFLLGVSMGVMIFGATYSGVLTGFHRWATHHSVFATTNILSVLAMVTVLSLGYGIVALGVVQVVCGGIGFVMWKFCANRACPGLQVSMRLADRKTMRSMIGFGARMAVGRVSRIILAQTSSILIAAFMGPAALAMFVRPRSLVRQAAVFPQKYSFMLVPTVAALFGARKISEVRDFVISSSRTGLYMSLPIIVFLLIGGTPLIMLWMGGHYADPALITMLTLALASEVFYQPLDNLLIGLNLHGRPALVMLAAALASIVFSWLALSNGFGLLGVAFAIGVPWTFAHGIYLPLYACKRLEIHPLPFFRSVWAGPLSSAIPFAAILTIGRMMFPHKPIAGLVTGGIVGGAFLAFCYWRWVLPTVMKQKIALRLRLPLTIITQPAQPSE